jgi:hypothetical protein
MPSSFRCCVSLRNHSFIRGSTRNRPSKVCEAQDPSLCLISRLVTLNEAARSWMHTGFAERSSGVWRRPVPSVINRYEFGNDAAFSMLSNPAARIFPQI